MLSLRVAYFAILFIGWQFFLPTPCWALPQFPIHSGFSSETLDKYSYTNDFDQDGILDWGVHPGMSNYLIPLDNDLDNDGIENLLDEAPYRPDHFTYFDKTELPPHLLSKNNALLRSVQKKVYKLAGIVIVADDAQYEPKIGNALIKILQRFGPSQTKALTKKLKSIYILNSDPQNEALGFYVDPLNAIILNRTISSFSESQIISTIAHEMGHAYIFGNVSPRELASISSKYGGWPLYHPTSHYDKTLTQRFWGQNKFPVMFPSSYAFANIHEWFAENFAHYVLKKMDLLSEKRTVLDFWLETKLRRAQSSPRNTGHSQE